jgi:L-alanine-DL-glutamate epimerase-like enolase superfamily enzyme
VRITSIETRSYLLPLEPAFAAAWDPQPRLTFPETIITITTDEGLSVFCGGAPVPDRHLIDSNLLGVDPRDTEQVWSVIESIDFHGGRNWTVEVAVWDLQAKLANQPLWQHLGGSRDRIRAYASSGERVTLDTRVARLRQWVDEGIGAAKLRFYHPDWHQDIAVVEAAREAVGAGMVLMVDANQGWRMPGDVSPRWDLATARSCAEALAGFGVYWLEEPLDTDDVNAYRELRESSPVPIAAGEMVRSLAGTRRLIEDGRVDFIQNDVVLAGGIGGSRLVAEWAKAAGIVWSPHTWSTGFGLLANLHAALAWSTAEYLEVPYDPPGWSPERRDYMLPFHTSIDQNGMIAAPPGPGLGVEPDFADLERWRVA